MKKWYTPVFIQLVTPGPYRNKRIVTILIWPPGTTIQVLGFTGTMKLGGYQAMVANSGYFTGINNGNLDYLPAGYPYGGQ
jgi:hypothetical protein